MWLTVEEPQLRDVIDEALTRSNVFDATFLDDGHRLGALRRDALHGRGFARDSTAGVIDLLFKSSDAWQVVDYKTDVVGVELLPDRYQQQIARYVSALGACGLHPVRGSVEPVR